MLDWWFMVFVSPELKSVKILFKVELHEVHIFTSTVLCDFEQICNASESGLASQRWRDVVELYLIDTIDDD
jgi:hypothetical protein